MLLPLCRRLRAPSTRYSRDFNIILSVPGGDCDRQEFGFIVYRCAILFMFWHFNQHSSFAVEMSLKLVISNLVASIQEVRFASSPTHWLPTVKISLPVRLRFPLSRASHFRPPSHLRQSLPQYWSIGLISANVGVDGVECSATVQTYSKCTKRGKRERAVYDILS